MSGRTYYCFCDSNCKFETMTKEQILAAIAQAAAGGLSIDEDAAFITKVKENNAGGYVTFWVGTQAQFNALESTDTNCQYIITDSKKDEELEARLAAIEETAAAGLQMQLIWEWDNIYTDDTGFAQTTISADLSAYMLLVIQFIARQSDGDGDDMVMECAATIGSGFECVATYAGMTNLERRYQVEKTGVTFGVAREYNSGVYAIDNTKLIPRRIYGVKG